MFGIGAQELVIILVVALLVFGPKRLPELARTVGRGLAEFRRASTDLRQSIQLDVEHDLAERRAAEIAEERKQAGESAPADAAANGSPTEEREHEQDHEHEHEHEHDGEEAPAATTPGPAKDTPGG